MVLLCGYNGKLLLYPYLLLKYYVSILHKSQFNIVILILYFNFGQQILQEKFNFRGILNLDVETRSDQILKPDSDPTKTLGSGRPQPASIGGNFSF